MRYFVAGGAGFIGSHLVDRLLTDGHEVTAYDNFSTGRREFLEAARRYRRFRCVEADLRDLSSLRQAMADHDFVFDLTPPGSAAPAHLLEAMRQASVRRLATCAPIAADPGTRAFCFRLAATVGERCMGGPISELYARLLDNPRTIILPADAARRGPGLHVLDCVDAMLTAIERSPLPVTAVDLAADETWSVDEALTWICEALGLQPRRRKVQGNAGPGDADPLDTTFMRSLGWRPERGVRTGVLEALHYLQNHDWMIEQPAAAA